MNENIRQLIRLYAAGSKGEIKKFLEGLSRMSLEATLIDILTLYFNDKNSSYLRELAVLYIAGYEPVQGKLGYNGYRMRNDGSREDCEVKPQNTDRKDKKLNGGGSFNDYTPERFQRDQRQNPMILAAGFVSGQLIYILQIPFDCIAPKLRKLIDRRFPKGRNAGEYLRSASFSFKDYETCEAVKLIYLREHFEDFADYLASGFANFLRKVSIRNTL